MRKYLAPLVGGKIVGVGVSAYGFPQIKVDSMENGFTGTIEISRDTEGNGPGFIFGLPEVNSASSDPEPAIDPRPWGDKNVELFKKSAKKGRKI